MSVISRAPGEAIGQDPLARRATIEPARDTRFDHVTRLAARLWEVPIAFVGLLDGEDEVIASSLGMSIQRFSRSDSLVERAVQAGGFFLEDAAASSDLASHPLLNLRPSVRFLASLPIRGPEFAPVGTLTIADYRPRRWSAADADRLRDLVTAAESEVIAPARESMENSLAFQKMLLDALTEASNDGILLATKDRTILSFNRRFVDLWSLSGRLRPGMSMEEVVPMVMNQIEDPAAFLVALQVIGDQRTERAHASIRLKGDRTLDLMSVPVLGVDRTYQGRVTFFHDATGRVQALDAYRESEERFGVLTDAAFEGIAASRKGMVTIANPAFATMFGYPISEVIGRPISDFVAPECRATSSLDGTTLPEGTMEFLGLKKDGTRFPIEVNRRSIPYKGDRIWVAVVRDVAARKLAQEELVRLSHRNALILNSAGDGIVGLDRQGNVTFANPSAARMTGFKVEELLGQRLHDRVHSRRVDGSPYPYEECPQEKVLRLGTPRRVTGEVFWRKDGTSFPVEYVSAPIPEGEEIVGAVVTFKDISERHLIERMKDEFISVVSHELRTPLTSIRGSLGLLASGMIGPMPDRAQHMLDIAVKNTDRLVNLINDILDIERIESGKVTMHKADCDSVDLITQSVDVMQALADKVGVVVSATPFSAPLFADPDRIVQVLTNLLSNAIKFSYPGGTVWLDAERRGDDIRFRVRDQGRGIPADKLEKIFERFQQVDTSDSREKGGTGLGLAICRSIVHQHGGRIWAETGPAPRGEGLGSGSTFFFTLPTVGNDSQNSVVPTGGDAPGQASQQAAPTRRVLIVEDDQDLVEVLIAMFQRHGVETYSARTGRDAIQLSQRVLPDLLVLDLVLPEGDGFTVVDWLRQYDRLRDVSLVVYSARDLSDADRARLKLARTEYVTKGRITPDEFETEVIALLDRIAPRRE